MDKNQIERNQYNIELDQSHYFFAMNSITVKSSKSIELYQKATYLINNVVSMK